MPALILTGHPSAGKSTFAELLASRALSHKSALIKSIVIVNEESARPDKTLRECYSNSTEEKLTRGALKSEFDKYVKDPTQLVILDSMNYIKGFRYELHCISKAAGQKHGVVWTLCREDVAKAWNVIRSKATKDKENYYYTQEMMNELICRFEPPDQRNRWDRPLYRVDVHSTLEDALLEKLGVVSGDSGVATGEDGDSTGDAAEQALNRSVYNMHSLSDAIRDSSQSKVFTSQVGTKSGFKRKVGSGFKRAAKNDQSEARVLETEDNTSTSAPTPVDNKEEAEMSVNAETIQEAAPLVKRQVKNMDDLIDTILDSFLLDVEPLKKGLSTMMHTSATSNVLHDVDSISQETMNSFLAAQQAISAGGGGGRVIVKIGASGETCSIDLKRSVQIAEMKRLRRQYIKGVSANPPNDTSEEGIAKSFLSYIKNQV